MKLLNDIVNRLPIRRNKVVFYSFTDTYADQPKYIAEELLSQKQPYELVWISKKQLADIPTAIRTVRWSLRALYELATARVIISNTRIGKYFDKGYVKKPEQIYIQTWHGSFGIKKMEADSCSLRESYIRRAKLDSKNIDYLLSNCRWLTDTLRSCFFYAGVIKEVGSPRNDILFSSSSSALAVKVKKKLGIEEDSRIVLYAPTFRSGKEPRFSPLDYAMVKESLMHRFGGKWQLLVRLHPGFMGKRLKWLICNQGEINVSHYPDMAELLVAADVMISDYSSCIFDYLLTGKPAFLYAPDADSYAQENAAAVERRAA